MGAQFGGDAAPSLSSDCQSYLVVGADSDAAALGVARVYVT